MARYVPDHAEVSTVLTGASLGILRQKGIEVHSMTFLRQNTLPLVVSATVALAVVLAEVRVIFPDDR